MKCFKCKKDFKIKALILHFKIFHSLNKFSEYQCDEYYCKQYFKNLDTFKRHIKKHDNNNLLAIKKKNLKPITSKLPIRPSYASGGISKLKNTSSCTPAGLFEDLSVDNSNMILELKDSFPKTMPRLNNEDAISEIYNSSAKFCIQLHSNDNFNIKNVNQIQNSVTNLVTAPIANYLENIMEIDDINDIKKQLNIAIELSKNPFQICNTHHKLNKWLLDNQLIAHLHQFSINDDVDIITAKGEAIYDNVYTKGVMLPLKFIMKAILEKTGLPKNIFETSRDEDIFSSFMNSRLWHEKISGFPNKKCLPFFLFFDAFEVNNCLSSHSESITGIYFSFPFLENCSHFENIFVAGFLKSEYFNTFGNDLCLKHLISEIKSLEDDGITLNLSSGAVHVHLILGLILGDNLGINSVFDFSKSFSSHHFCRFCISNKLDTRYQCANKEENARTLENYESNITEKSFKECGIHKNSIFNEISSFHVLKNYFVDLMHDVFEGICHYELCQVIKYYIEKVKLFSLETLNRRKQNFNYGPIDIGNISPEILTKDLKNRKLKMTASEMKCFIHYFPLMLGDLVPENDEVWKFVTDLVQIVDILLSKSFNNSKLLFLSQLIEEHFTEYIQLFKDTLKPKHHLILHYTKVIMYSGAPRNYWCFGYEAKHKEIKTRAKATNSRKNICMTLAKKQQLKLAYFLMTPLRNILSTCSRYSIKSNHLTALWNKLKISAENIKCYSQVVFKGILYKNDFFLTRYNEVLELFKINEIFVTINEESIIILVDQIFIDSLNPHYQAYEIKDSNNIISNNIFINIKEFAGPPINPVKTVNGKTMIRLKEYF